MKKIIVFGASGNTGRYFTDYFLEHIECGEYAGRYELIAVGTRQTDYFEKAGVRYYRVDITRKDNFGVLPMEDLYAVVDLAGAMPAKMKGYDPYRYIDVNITGTLNILEYCRQCGADRILFAQSFGDIKDHAQESTLLTADMPRKFSYASDHTIYVMSKNFAVDLIENYHQMYGLKRFIFRLPTIYMWSEDASYCVDGVPRLKGYRAMINKAMRGEPIEVWGDAQRVKDMVYVKDFCQMLYLALFANRSEGYYNVGTGEGVTLLTFAQRIRDVFGTEGRMSDLILRPDMPDSPQYIMDITSAREELGYAPQFTNLKWLEDFKIEMKRGESSC